MTAWTNLQRDYFESHDSRDSDWNFESGEKQQTRKAIVQGYNTPEEAAEYAVSAPDTTTPLFIPYNPDTGDPALVVSAVRSKTMQPNCYELTFVYKSLAVDDEQNLTWTFSGQTEGGTTTLTQGYAYQSYGTGPNYAGAINVSKDGVEGVEVGLPGLEFTITKSLQRGQLSLEYVATLVRMTYSTNNAAFGPFAQGELLFKGAEFSQRSGGETSVSFKFSASPNRVDLVFGSVTGVAKKGHEYLWVDYAASESGGFIIRTPRTVHVHRVYPESDFGALQIDE
jgi:hypothetical protein